MDTEPLIEPQGKACKHKSPVLLMVSKSRTKHIRGLRVRNKFRFVLESVQCLEMLKLTQLFSIYVKFTLRTETLQFWVQNQSLIMKIYAMVFSFMISSNYLGS
jgi:hypothetical protein